MRDEHFDDVLHFRTCGSGLLLVDTLISCDYDLMENLIWQASAAGWITSSHLQFLELFELSVQYKMMYHVFFFAIKDQTIHQLKNENK